MNTKEKRLMFEGKLPEQQDQLAKLRLESKYRDITLPNGFVYKNVPETISREEVLHRAIVEGTITPNEFRTSVEDPSKYQKILYDASMQRLNDALGAGFKSSGLNALSGLAGTISSGLNAVGADNAANAVRDVSTAFKNEAEDELGNYPATNPYATTAGQVVGGSIPYLPMLAAPQTLVPQVAGSALIAGATENDPSAGLVMGTLTGLTHGIAPALRGLRTAVNDISETRKVGSIGLGDRWAGRLANSAEDLLDKSSKYVPGWNRPNSLAKQKEESLNYAKEKSIEATVPFDEMIAENEYNYGLIRSNPKISNVDKAKATIDYLNRKDLIDQTRATQLFGDPRTSGGFGTTTSPVLDRINLNLPKHMTDVFNTKPELFRNPATIDKILLDEELRFEPSFIPSSGEKAALITPGENSLVKTALEVGGGGVLLPMAIGGLHTPLGAIVGARALDRYVKSQVPIIEDRLMMRLNTPPKELPSLDYLPYANPSVSGALGSMWNNPIDGESSR